MMTAKQLKTHIERCAVHTTSQAAVKAVGAICRKPVSRNIYSGSFFGDTAKSKYIKPFATIYDGILYISDLADEDKPEFKLNTNYITEFKQTKNGDIVLKKNNGEGDEYFYFCIV